jgi:broad specificity phosphatase PhoE
MKIYLIRHAQAMHNVTGNTGLLDPEITELGKQQCLNKKENYLDVNMVISSTATRTLQTTSLLFKNIPTFATDLLLEYNTGASCNCRHSLSQKKIQYKNIDFTIYLVEELQKEITWADGEARAKKLIELLNKIKNNNIVLALVSHANFIRNIMALLSKYNSEELENCGSYIIYL